MSQEGDEHVRRPLPRALRAPRVDVALAYGARGSPTARQPCRSSTPRQTSGGRGALTARLGWCTALTGSVVVDHFHQEQHDVFPIIAAHFVGMYALVIVVGDLVDRIGRTRALAGG